MSGGTHPFAAAGGGHLFEYKVATLVAADLIRSRYTELGGVVAAIEMQTGPVGFEDLQVSVELAHGGNRTVHAQCRYRQPFTASSKKFVTLLTRAAAAVSGDALAFAAGDRRLVLTVDRDSPGHVSMAQLCELAGNSGDLDRFVGVVGAHGGRVETRWEYCLQAASDLEPELLHRILASLEVRAVELGYVTSRDSVELINRLAEAWVPKSPERATGLGNALFKLLTDVGPTAGIVDLSFLQSHLRAELPGALGAETRRAKLSRRRDGGHRRVAATMKAIGLNPDEADELATSVLADPPRVTSSEELTVVTGGMGIGKTTELERVHRAAINRALEDPIAPIPVFLDAREIVDSPLLTVVSQQCDGLGDPTSVGVHLIIDALDEAGVQVADLPRRIATLQADWPNSVVLVGTRPEAELVGVRTTEIEPLTPEAAQSLMAAIHPGITRLDWLRKELSEALCRPLFAIRFALDHRQGNQTGTSEGHLVRSVGQQALKDIGDTTNDAFELLVRLACRVVDSGGRPVNLNSLEATPAQVSRLMGSRIIQTADGHVSFQLAALTEWFAAIALLKDSTMLARSVSTAIGARRWRQVFAQALMQGSADQVDCMMSTLLERAPATAAWVHHRVQESELGIRSAPLAEGAEAAGVRIRRAVRAWIEPWPHLIERYTDDGELPTLGVSFDGQWLTTAWRWSADDSSEAVVQLPPDVDLFGITDRSWTQIRLCSASSGEMWPWEWSRGKFEEDIDRCLDNGELLAGIDLCWPELAWSYANQMLDRHADATSEPVQRADLEAIIARYGHHTEEGGVGIGGGVGDWNLVDGETFVADLTRRGMIEVEPPWAPSDAQLGKEGATRTTDQLLARLRQITKTALDIYQHLVARLLPSMAADLNTYQLLPARIVGLVPPVDPKDSSAQYLNVRWYIEPLPKGSQNEARWNHWNPSEREAGDDWASRRETVQELRRDVAECISLTTHLGEPAFSSTTPACSFALQLLHDDLYEFGWTRGPASFDSSGCTVRPRYMD